MSGFFKTRGTWFDLFSTSIRRYSLLQNAGCSQKVSFATHFHMLPNEIASPTHNVEKNENWFYSSYFMIGWFPPSSLSAIVEAAEWMWIWLIDRSWEVKWVIWRNISLAFCAVDHSAAQSAKPFPPSFPSKHTHTHTVQVNLLIEERLMILRSFARAHDTI